MLPIGLKDGKVRAVSLPDAVPPLAVSGMILTLTEDTELWFTLICRYIVNATISLSFVLVNGLQFLD